MDTRTGTVLTSAVLSAALLLSACGIDVREGATGDENTVDIRTPVGGLSVRTDVGASGTGLAVYPGARPLREGDDPESADIDIGLPFVGVKVVAAKFETDSTPDAIVDYYKSEMKTYGPVTECRGNVTFRRNRVVCRDSRASRDVQLVVGTEERHRLVSVKPRRSGSEFAIVYIETRE